MKVSIVVPCRDEEKHIVGCVDSLFALNFDEKLEELSSMETARIAPRNCSVNCRIGTLL